MENLVLNFGAYDLNNQNEPGTYSVSPSNIIMHPDWNPTSDVWDADIALILTKISIEYTKFISPICLWERDTEPAVENGHIAGWGQSANSKLAYEPIPKMLEIPIKDQVGCFLESPLFAKMSSTRTFCGGPRNGSGPCLGKLY